MGIKDVFKKESVEYHEACKAHSHAKSIIEAQSQPVVMSEAARSQQMLNSKQLYRLCILFRTCHAIAKKCRPYMDYVWHCELDKVKGLDIGNTYLTDKYARVFTQSIVEIELINLRK